jgi:hypothetical protein
VGLRTPTPHTLALTFGSYVLSIFFILINVLESALVAYRSTAPIPLRMVLLSLRVQFGELVLDVTDSTVFEARLQPGVRNWLQGWKALPSGMDRVISRAETLRTGRWLNPKGWGALWTRIYYRKA